LSHVCRDPARHQDLSGLEGNIELGSFIRSLGACLLAASLAHHEPLLRPFVDWIGIAYLRFCGMSRRLLVRIIPCSRPHGFPNWFRLLGGGGGIYHNVIMFNELDKRLGPTKGYSILSTRIELTKANNEWSGAKAIQDSRFPGRSFGHQRLLHLHMLSSLTDSRRTQSRKPCCCGSLRSSIFAASTDTPAMLVAKYFRPGMPSSQQQGIHAHIDRNRRY